MICYKDRTFCPFYKNCQNGATCFRSLTDKVKSDAKAWWGGNGEAPICVFTEAPPCHMPKGLIAKCLGYIGTANRQYKP